MKQLANIQKFTLLKRGDNVTREQFLQHWRDPHGPLLASVPEFWKYNTRYFQNHPIRLPSSIGAEPFYDGVAQLIQRPRDDMSVGFFEDPKYLEVIRPDELNFLSTKDCTAVFAREHVIKDGPRTGVKMISFLTRAGHLSHDQFLEHWLTRHAPLVRNAEPFWRRLRRYVQNHCIPELSRAMLVDGKVETFSGVTELWFDSVQEAEAAFGAPEFIERVRPDSALFIAAREMRFMVMEVEVKQPAPNGLA